MNTASPRTSGGALFQWFLRIAGYATFAGIAAAGSHGLFGLVHWQTWLAYPLIGGAMSFLGWCAGRLWQVTVAHMLKHPDSLMGPMTRVPFWFFAGGMGYEIGMFAAKKMRLLGCYDTPAKPLFHLGGTLGCLLWLLMEIAGSRRGEEKYRKHA